MNADKPGTQEHEQSAFKDKLALNDGTIPSGNSMLSSCLSSTSPPNFFPLFKSPHFSDHHCEKFIVVAILVNFQ